MQSNVGKFRDSTPELAPAGKVFDQGGTASECIHGRGPEPPVPAVVGKFSNTDVGRPPCGEARIHHGRANDEDLASLFYHGVSTSGSARASELVSPAFQSRFKAAMDKKKEGLYLSKKERPLGEIRTINASYMPDTVDRLATTFGKPTVFDGTAGECVNPDKSAADIASDADKYHDMYATSHHDFRVGEAYDRKYDWSTFTRDSTYGITTPHSNAGEFTKRTLKWIHDVNTEKGAKIVAELVDDFREKSQPQLGKVHDPIVETLKVPADHTFGIMLRPDEYGAGDLLHGRAPNAYLRGRDRERGVLHAIRQHLKKANYHNFDDLSQAFAHYDKNGDGFIDANELGEVCHQLNVPIEDEMLALLMSYCACADSGPLRIDYLKFANFLNWKDKMPLPADKRNGKELPVPATPTLPKQIDRAVTQHMTSSSVIGALADISTYGYRKYGVPTVRADLAPPKLKRVSDTKNYGDESDAYGVVNPSIYSRAGVYESDFFAPRSRDEIKMIFANVGVDIAPDTFDQAWTRAASRDPRSRGEVCVETFRSVLDDVQAQAILSQ